MLISFPFLRNVTPEEADAIDDGTFNLGEKSGKGAFPVSHLFGWHGGVHLIAPPGASNNPEPVRAIADGVVVFARHSDPMPLNSAGAEIQAAHPLLYFTGWTSNGVMILKHDTEIGEGVSVTFYSICQHLHTLANKPGTETPLKKGDKVYRKDPIGKAGAIYGKPNRIHFEIVADKANVEQLMGRSAGKLTTTEGRRTSVWGDMHIVLPAGTPLYVQDPRTETKPYLVRPSTPTPGAIKDTLESVAQRFHTTPQRIRQINGTPANAANWWSTVMAGTTQTQRTIRVPAQYGAAATSPPADLTVEEWSHWQATIGGRTTAELIISLSEAKGTITLTTRAADGTVIDKCTEDDGAYNLYKTAVEAYPGCPSAGYELLRFGRVLGPDAPAATDLHDGRLPHFRKIATQDGMEAFADLNRVGVKVYSDADFPHWQGWTFIDDDTDGNSRCDSTQLLDIIEPMTPTPQPAPSLPGALGDAVQAAAQALDSIKQYKERIVEAYVKIHAGTMRKRLSSCVVKLPTEWSRDDFDKRWGWVKGDDANDRTTDVLVSICLSPDAYEKFKRHHAALAFWEDAVKEGLALDKVHYHFHPVRFIEAFKTCGWLSLREQTQLLPRSSMPEAGGSNLFWSVSRSRFLTGNPSGSVTSPPGLGLALNHVFRTFGFTNALRQAHLLAQCFKESGALKWTAELGGADYFRKMYEVYTPQEAAYDFDNRHQWLSNMGFLKNRDRPTYIAQRPGEIHNKALAGGNTQPGDGARFRGRGLIHLTWRNGYRDYGLFRNRNFTTDPSPELVQSDAEIAAHSAGYFWAMKRINRLADRGASDDDVKNCFKLVGGAGGLPERQQFFRYTYFILNDAPNMPIENGLRRQFEE